MKKSPSLFFRLLADDSALPAVSSGGLPPRSSDNGAAKPIEADCTGVHGSNLYAQTTGTGGVIPPSTPQPRNSWQHKLDSASEVGCLGTGTADSHSKGVPAAEAAATALQLNPREVLQELLDDLYIDIGRLHLGELLGQGGFAEVHRAQLEDPLVSFTEWVAVKQLRPDVLKSADDLREFLMEANLLRKLRHRHIVGLVGVGAQDCSNLVRMRESMYVVQELMEGGDLKQLLMNHMKDPFGGVYTKADGLKWAMQVAEALSYLHEVCKPMIIHRDLKLDNILLTGGPVSTATAKLADFGLHKRVRKMAATDMWVTWQQEATYHGDLYEPSFYGGTKYLMGASVLDGRGSVHGGQLALAGNSSSRPGSTNNSLHAASSYQQLAMGGGSSTAAAAAAAAAGAPAGALPSITLPEPCGSSSSALEPSPSGLLLQSAVRARDNGMMEEGELLAHIIAATSTREGSLPPVAQGPLYADVSVHRKVAAAQALDRSVHHGNQFYATAANKQQQQQQQQRIVERGAGAAPHSTPPRAGPPALMQEPQPLQQPQQQQQQQPQPQQNSISGSKKGGAGGANSRNSRAGSKPGLGVKRVDATQAVGSLLYMAPEVVRGDQYDEKVDVFSFGIILYELFTGVILASRVAADGSQEELEVYAKSVSEGHREELPPSWHPALKKLVSSCWAQDPAQRPSFKEVLRELYRLKKEGVAEAMDAARPRGDYNPVTDCGCVVM